MPKTEKDKRKDKVIDAYKRAVEGGSAKSAVQLPPGIEKFELDKAGEYKIDILPFRVKESNPAVRNNWGVKEGDLYFERLYWQHPKVGANETFLACPLKCAGEKCAICDHLIHYTKEPGASKEIAKGFKAKVRQLFAVRDYSDGKKWRPRIWDVAPFNFGELLEEMIKSRNPKYEYRRRFADLKQGSHLNLTVKKESYEGRAFYKVVGIDFELREKPYDKSIIKDVPCLDDLVKVPSSKQVKMLFEQTITTGSDDDEDEDDDRDDDDDDEAPRKKKKKKEDEDEDDDEDEDEDSEDNAAEEAGIEVGSKVVHEDFGLCKVVSISSDGSSLKIKDKKGKVHKAVEVDEVELKGGSKKSKDEDDEDEDEDEAPRKKKPKKKGKKTVEQEEEDDDEDEEEEDEDEDDDEDESPRKKKPKKKGKKSKKDDDDDDEDSGWDDEDDTPY